MSSGDGGNDIRSLSARMSELALQLQKSSRSIEDTMKEITSAAVTLVPSTQEASISFIVRPRTVESRAATSELPVRSRAAVRAGEGPCLDAVWERTTVVVDDLSTEPRWPRFAPAAVFAGVQAMLCFRLYTDGERSGALNLFSAQPSVFGEDGEEHGALVATHAAIALIGAEHHRQFQSALATAMRSDRRRE